MLTRIATILCALAVALPAEAQKKPAKGKAPPAAAAPPAAPAPPPMDPTQIAKRLCDAAGVRELEAVVVQSAPGTLGVAEAVVLEASRRGAWATVTYTSPRLEKGLQTEAPMDFLARTSPLDVALVEIADVVISLPPPADPALFADVPEERAAARRKGMKAVNDAQMQRETRIVSLGNAAFPGEGLAKLYGGDLAQLSRSFWDAVQADPKEIADRGAKVRERLSGNRVVRVTDPRGTDLTVKLGSRRVTVTSGLLASDEALQPGPAFLWLPAGEVYTVPTEFSADGRVRIDVGGYRGQLVRDLTLVFREGKLVSVEGGPASGAALLQKALAASDGAKDVLAVLDLGVNPRSRPVAGSAFRSFEMDGMVTLGIGQNSWAGGSNASDFAWYFQLADATVAVDGVALVENGQLKL